MTNEPGNYAVHVTTDFGCDIESEVYILESSVGEVADDILSLFPNPATREISVLMSAPGDWFIQDLTGRRVVEGTSGSSQFAINITQLNAGVYLFCAHSSYVRMVKE